jgi:hypothetical protein
MSQPLRQIFSRLCLLASLVLGLPNSPALAADVTASLSTNSIRVGDRVTLSLDVNHATGERLLLPDLTREPVIIVWNSRLDRAAANDDRETTTATIEFSSFVIGEHRIGTNTLTLLSPEGRESVLLFPDLTINVVSILTNPPPELADLKPPAKLRGWPWLRVIWIMLAVTLLALLAALLIRRWLSRPEKLSVTRLLPAHEIALTALDALRRRGHIERGEFEPFYVELSAIVRVYLEDRFKLHAPEQTTEEFIRSSSQSNALSLEHRQLTQEFLEQSDLVKFARFEPSAQDMERAWDAAAKLVRETMEAAPVT